jgi:glucokinase
VGGTNARFAWQADADAPIVDARALPCADHPTLADALRRCVVATRQTGVARACAVAHPAS